MRFADAVDRRDCEGTGDGHYARCRSGALQR